MENQNEWKHSLFSTTRASICSCGMECVGWARDMDGPPLTLLPDGPHLKNPGPTFFTWLITRIGSGSSSIRWQNVGWETCNIFRACLQADFHWDPSTFSSLNELLVWQLPREMKKWHCYFASGCKVSTYFSSLKGFCVDPSPKQGNPLRDEKSDFQW